MFVGHQCNQYIQCFFFLFFFFMVCVWGHFSSVTNFDNFQSVTFPHCTSHLQWVMCVFLLHERKPEAALHSRRCSDGGGSSGSSGSLRAPCTPHFMWRPRHIRCRNPLPHTRNKNKQQVLTPQSLPLDLFALRNITSVFQVMIVITASRE